MSNAFIRKLEGFAPLSDDDRSFLASLTFRTKEVEANQDLIREGDSPEFVHVILDGFVGRYKVTQEGRRQIFAYLIPGDLCDLHVTILTRMDHSIGALSPCRVVKLSPETIIEITEQRPAVARALWWSSLVDEATLREWLVNIGQRPAEQRIAHLFCELHVRLKAVGRTSEGSFELPLTQAELGDTMGLSTVHVNRSLKELRAAGLVSFKSERIVIPDVEHLKKYSGFDANYLHIRRAVAEDT